MGSGAAAGRGVAGWKRERGETRREWRLQR